MRQSWSTSNIEKTTNLILPNDISGGLVEGDQPQLWPLFPGLEAGQDRQHRSDPRPRRQEAHVTRVWDLGQGEVTHVVTEAHLLPGPQPPEAGGHGSIRVDLDQEAEAGVTLGGDAVDVRDWGVGSEYLCVLDHCPDVDMMTHRNTELTRGWRREDEQSGVVSHEAGLHHGPLSVGGGEILNKDESNYTLLCN